MNKLKLLIVEDEALVALQLRRALEKFGYEVLDPIATGEQAVEDIPLLKPDLILMDIRLAGKIDGVQAAAMIRTHWDIPIIYLSAHTADLRINQSVLTEPYGFIAKPVQMQELRATLEMAFYKHRLYQQLKASEARYRTLVETSPDAIALIDLDARIILCNEQAAVLCGYNCAETLTGKNVFDLFAPEDRPRAEWNFNLSDQVQTVWRSEYSLLKQDGSRIHIDMSASVLTDEKGNPTAVMAIVRDITEKKLAEARITKQQENFLKIFAAAPVGLLLLDQDTIITQANKTAADMVLRDPVEIIGQRGGGGLGCIHSAENPKGCGFGKYCATCPLRRGVEGVLSGGPSVHGAEIETTLLIEGIQQVRWLRVNAEPLEIDQKKFIILAIDDITERIKAETTLRNREHDFSTLVENASDMIVRFDSQKRYLYCNPAVERQFGHPAKYYLGKTPLEIQRDSRVNQFIDQSLSSVLENGQEIVVEQNVPTQFGTKYYQTRVVPERGENDHIETILAISRDVTDLKLAEEALRKSERQARSLAEEKSRLLDEVNHRINNNLALIEGLFTLELEQPFDAKVRDALLDMQGRVQSMATVHNILSTCQWTPMCIDHLTVVVIEGALSGSPIRDHVQVNIFPPDPLIWLNPRDATKIALVLNELTTNSVKYAFTGRQQASLTVSIMRQTDPQSTQASEYWPDAHPRTLLKFQDDGPGWPQEVLDGQRLGTGLAIIRFMVCGDLHGEITLSNENGAVALLAMEIDPINC